jgi:hypothetical protein
MTQVKKQIQNPKKEKTELSDEEIIEIKKKELLEYAEKMTSVKELHKKRSIESKAEVLELRDQNDYLISQFRKMRDKYNDTAKELKELQDRVNNKKVHRVNDFNDIIVGDLDEEMRMADEEAKKIYEEKRKKSLEDFKKQLLE